MNTANPAHFRHLIDQRRIGCISHWRPPDSNSRLSPLHQGGPVIVRPAPLSKFVSGRRPGLSKSLPARPTSAFAGVSESRPRLLPCVRHCGFGGRPPRWGGTGTFPPRGGRQYLPRHRLLPFIRDMAEAYAWADIVVCRAGALTVSEHLPGTPQYLPR